jgi:hypothetical protein
MRIMNEPLARRPFEIHLRALNRVAPPMRAAPARGWRTVQAGACFIVLSGALLCAAQVPEETLDAAAVMALTQAAGQRVQNRTELIAHDPHFMALTPIGLELVGARSRRLGAFESVEEYDYRNTEGEPLALLVTSAPLAPDARHWRARRVGDVRLLAWTSGGKRYVLSGRADTRGLMRAADALTMQ